MTKKETDAFENLTTVLKQNMEVQTEVLMLLRQMNAPISGGVPPEPVEEMAVKTTAPTPKPKIKEPEPVKEVTIEECRGVLGRMVEKVGEDQARIYLATFSNATMLPDLDPKDYAELVKGGEEILEQASLLGG